MTLLSWVLLSSSGRGGGIYAKLANRSGATQLRSGFPTLNSVPATAPIVSALTSFQIHSTVLVVFSSVFCD